MRLEYILPYLLVNLLVGAAIFWYGFFPLSFTSDERAQFTDLPEFIDGAP